MKRRRYQDKSKQHKDRDQQGSTRQYGRKPNASKSPHHAAGSKANMAMDVSGQDEKIQKVLARLGMGSRREIEGWIEEGRVSVNGQMATLGDRVGSFDRIRVDGHVVKMPRHNKMRRRVIIYNKPEGEVCTRDDPKGRPTVFNSLPVINNGRWISVGRLDINTSGLLIFTNDGELANQLMHPSFEVEREYAVRLLGDVTDAMLARLKEGVELEDGWANFDTITYSGGEGANSWYHVTIKEGRKREVRRLWESQDLLVSRLIRVRYGAVQMPRSLRVGRWEELTSDKIALILAQFQ